MKVTYNWLKDFVDIKISPKALADKLTMAGLEVTSIEEKEGDFVFEIEVTSNRPDCLSIKGIAREVAAITGKKLNNVSRIAYRVSRKNTKHKTQNTQPFSISIEDKKDCALYIAKVIADVKVRPSPDWLKKRLELVGCRSVNNIVDITNYVLFEYGEPLHAFDLDKLIGNNILVRRAKDNEKMTTIDGMERKLNPDTLVIADKEKPVAIAGIMGGKDTEVANNTKNILLEAAIFNQVIVRRIRQAQGLQSESAYRFERGIDFNIVDNASWRAVDLIQELAGGRCMFGKRCGFSRARKRNINLNVFAVHKILGVHLTPSKIKQILNRLGFRARATSKYNLKIEIPSHRSDINLEIDLIEEIGRIFGYENIPKTIPRVRPFVSFSDRRDLVSVIKNMLVGLGLNEVISYSLIDEKLLSNFEHRQESEAIEILNPLSKEQEILRPTIIPSLLGCVALNLNQGQESVSIFEVAKTFCSTSGQPNEELKLGIALSGTESILLEQGVIKDELGWLHLKGISEALFARLGIKNYELENTQDPFIISLQVNEEKIGWIFKLQKQVLDKFDIKNSDAFVLEISLDKLFTFVNLAKKFISIPRYPAITRDTSFLLKEDIKVGDILEAIGEKGRPLLRDVKIIDYYKGKQIPSGFRGLTVSCFYRSDERTLTEAEITPVHNLISDMLSQRFGAKIR
jgi:phenylalanyl-tRNA synthetase beta chain